MEEITLNWLNIDEMRILKQIIIISDSQNGEMEIGRILYTRQLNEIYNLKKQEKDDEKESNPIKRILNEYPEQKNYPVDRIDEIIFGSILRIYPKSKVRNETILFNLDMENIKVLKRRKTIKSVIYFKPDFSNLNIYKFMRNQFIAHKFDINIYGGSYLPELLEGQIFIALYDVNEQQVLDNLDTVNFDL